MHIVAGSRLSAALCAALALLALAPWIARSQPAPLAIRLALVSQWSVNQHRGGAAWGSQGPVTPDIRTALDRGVVDRPVFWWQRGAIQRSTLVWKPIRLLPASDAAALGGRGDFDLVAVRPPAGATAWTQVEVAPRGAPPGDVLVLEVGGELNTITQVLETVLLVPPDGRIEEVPLGRRAGGPAIPVVTVQFGRLPAVPATAFGGAEGIDFLVARSTVETLANADTTTLGPADKAMSNVGDWREGDRVFIRLPVARLAAGTPSVVLVWKDRTLKSDPDGGDFMDQRRRSRLQLPLVR